MRKIKLTRNKFAFIDDDDYKSVSKIKWYAKCFPPKNYFYAATTLPNDKEGNRKTLFMHRFIMKPPKGMLIDHINGKTLDNRKCNLRICTAADNQRNRHASKNTGSSMFGVTIKRFKNKKYYQAQKVLNGRQKYIGLFPSEIEAHQAVISYQPL